ncbi:hypothetical protein J0H58_04805 [bacterium]|nr:hypothetical protein [bacterium]
MMFQGSGEYVLVQEPVEQRQAALDRVKERCSVIRCRELANLAPQRRADLIGLLGRDGVETMCVAGRPGHVLWTDGVALAVCAKAIHPNIRRTWPQAAVFRMLDEQTFVDASARPLSWGYVPTQFGVATLVRAAAIAGWSAEVWPFPQAPEQFGESRRPLGERPGGRQQESKPADQCASLSDPSRRDVHPCKEVETPADSDDFCRARRRADRILAVRPPPTPGESS